MAAAFATQGLVFISLTTRLPAIQKHWDLSDVSLSLLLLMMVGLAGVGSIGAEVLAKRHSSARLLRLGLGLIAVAVPLIAVAPGLGVFVSALAVYGVALGVVDATTNMQAVALEHRYGRPILPSFYGAWTFGGVVGSAITLSTAHLPLAVAGLVSVFPLVVALAAFLPRTGSPVTVPAVDVPWRPLLLVGTAMVLFYMVDTAATTWGPNYLDHTFATPASLVALATFPYLLASGLTRLAGDRLVARFGPVALLRVGGLVASAALALIVGSPTWPVAVVGFTVLGAAVAVIAPLSFSAAARIAGAGLDDGNRQARVDAVIARFNQFNYAGALLGAVMTGLVGAGSLRFGFAVPMVLILVILPLARAFAPRRAEAAPGPNMSGRGA